MAKIIRLDSRDTLTGRLRYLADLATEYLQSGELEIHILRPSKSREQEKRYHAMIRDIAQQVTFGNSTRRYSVAVWKARLVEQFGFEKAQMGEPLRKPSETVTSLDGLRVITIRPSSKDFSVSEANEFIEYLAMVGAEMGVQFRDPSLEQYNQYREAA